MHSLDKTNNTKNESKNTNYFGILPRELITEGISSFLPIPDMRKLQQTCRFFKHHAGLNKKIEEQSKLTPWEIIAKGNNTYFMTGNGHVYILGRLARDKPKPIYLFNKQPIIKIITASNHAFFADVNGKYHVSGDNFRGLLGVDDRNEMTEKEPPVPFHLPNGKSVAEIVAGAQTSFIQDTDGNWYACGDNSSRQLGIEIDYSIPFNRTPILIPLPGNKPILKVVAAIGYTFFQDKSGQWFGCGWNGYGALGVKSEDNCVPNPTPIHLPNNKSIVDIIVGSHHTLMRDEDGNWYGCGCNLSGQLGINKTKTKVTLTPFSLPNNKPIIEIVTGTDQTFFRDADDNWYGCGSNVHRQLGIDCQNKEYIDEPMLITLPNNEKIIKIVAADKCTFFLDVKHSWHGAGSNDSRELGFKEKTTIEKPTLINFSEFEKEINSYEEKTHAPEQRSFSL